MHFGDRVVKSFELARCLAFEEGEVKVDCVRVRKKYARLSNSHFIRLFPIGLCAVKPPELEGDLITLFRWVLGWPGQGSINIIVPNLNTTALIRLAVTD